MANFCQIRHFLSTSPLCEERLLQPHVNFGKLSGDFFPDSLFSPLREFLDITENAIIDIFYIPFH